MCITMRVPWLTIDRLRGCRDIRLSAATMRALNSRRPRSTVSISRLVPRSALCLLLLLCVLHDVRARSVSHDDDSAVDQVHDEISEAVEVSDSDPADANNESAAQVRRKSWIEKTQDEENEDDSEARKISEEKIVLVEDPEKIQTEDEGSVAKKRRRNDVILPVILSVLQDVKSVQKDEGIRRFDSQVELDDAEGLKQRKASDDIAEDIPNSQTDDLKQKKLIDSKQSQAGVKNLDANLSDKDEAEDEINKEIPFNLEEKLGNIASLEEKADLNKAETGQIENLAEHLDEARIEKTEEVNEEIRNDLRSLELCDTNEDGKNQKEHIADKIANGEISVIDPNREDRHLSGASGKSKYKSSTVYLNAEERSLPAREQESIVDGQIKKLISIRDDALETIDNGAKHPEKLDEGSLISEKSIAEEGEEVRSQRSSNARDVSARSEDLEEPLLAPQPSRFQHWKDQAALLQDQIKNQTFLQYLRKQATEVLPDIPKFTEIQLLETLRNIALSRKSSSNETYLASLNATELSENQLEIIKCAEQLMETKQRQSFTENIGECIRGLSVLNCIRIFVWPTVLDNLPDSVKQTLNNLPVEINLIDLFQGDRAKSARSEGGFYYLRLLTPEYIVFTILQGTLESKATYDLTPTYIDPQNETLRTLLTTSQLQILQMAEKLLPAERRREYSDRMFSCVRRFEYFSCVKYFAWPMVKQHHPELPPFPDYPNWYPSLSLYPQYPIVPFPSFVENTGELPEVVEADATRLRNPEAVIVNILHDALKEHVKTSSPSVTYTNSYVALLPPEQLLSINIAEQLLPVSYRSEFVEKTVRCIQEFNYPTCIRYSTWPTVKQFIPSLPSFPNISEWIPSFSNFFGFISNLPSFPSFIPDLSSFFPSLGGGGQTTPSPSPPAEISNSTSSNPPARIVTLLQSEISSELESKLENKIIEILTNVQNSLRATPGNLQSVAGGNKIILKTVTEKQVNILKLAESIVPPPARVPLDIQVLSCLQNNDFINCTRHIIWPILALYVPNLPEFPDLPNQQPSKLEDQQTLLKNKNALHPSGKEQEWDKSQNANSNVNIISRMKFPQSSDPMIRVTGTQFWPIFMEHPESVLLNILRQIQPSSPNVLDDHGSKYINVQQFSNLLNDQQLNIIKITESLLPDEARPAFVNRMTECVRKNNFLECSRDLVWPILSKYLPNFPNFEYLQSVDNKSILPQNLTDPSPLSEIDVKVGQHGDATVTITDTRFIPISEHPEDVILKILTALQNTTSGTVHSSMSKLEKAYFTERQTDIIQVAENLLPASVRPAFVEKMITCVREIPFLECTRVITWPTVAQFFPRLPNFLPFGTQNLRKNINLSSLRNAYSGNQASESNENTRNAMETQIEEKIENVLKDLFSEELTPRLENSYLDANNLAADDLLTAREMNIVKLAEKAIPDSMRRAYVSNLLECVRYNNFATCTQHVTWPTVKQFSPTLPNFDGLLDQFPISGAGQIPGLDQIPIGQFPGSGQFPDISQLPVGQIPSFPGAGNPFAEAGPSLPQFPPIPSLPGFPGLPQFPGGNLPQLPIAGLLPGGGLQPPQFPGLPQFPGFPSGSSLQFGIQSDAPQESKPQESKPQKQPVQSRVAEQANQINGVSRAANTPSVEYQSIVPGYLGQPSDVLLDISNEKVQSEIKRPLLKSIPTDLPKKHERKRRSAEQLSNSYYEISGELEHASEPTMDDIFPNITESEFLQLLINITKTKNPAEKNTVENPKEYFVDTLNATVRNSLTADQYEILKITEDLNEYTANRGFFSRIFYCLLSLSFMKCIGIFVWPMIINNVPSLVGLPFSAPMYPPSLAKSIETEMQNFFGMSTGDFEKELLTRKESAENIFLDWYKKAMEEKFQTNLGFLKITGYGNGEVGISFGGFREGRATKIKDNKNLPSILTIISDIMEEVLDQRPDNEKMKKEKEKRERSLDDMQETDFQFLKESDEFADIKRSINDDQIITMFLDKIKANATDFADGNVAQFLNEDAYNAFGVLFGTRLNEKFATRLKAFNEEHLNKNNPDDRVKELSTEELKVIPLKEEVTYDLEKESTGNHEERKREHRAKNELISLLDKYSDKLVKSISTETIESPDNENKIKDSESPSDENTRSELRIHLPRLREDVLSRKITSTMIHLGRALKTKMSNMLPGIGFIITFFIQMALAHARAAASMAGMISNMALASAVFGMIRQNLLGDNPKIKYVYDNDKMGPGITWPHHHHESHHEK